MRKARDIRWRKYIISAPPPFDGDVHTLDALDRSPAEVITKIFPEVDAVFKQKGWKHLTRIDRVYDSSRAVRNWDGIQTIHLRRQWRGWCAGEQWKSDLTARVGKKGYHTVSTGVYKCSNCPEEVHRSKPPTLLD